MNWLRQITFGNQLTKLTNIVEEITQRERQGSNTAPLSGDWLDARQSALYEEMDRRSKALAKHPRHVVTRELCKNMRVSMQLGRRDRLQAQSRLLDVLVSAGLALHIDEFAKSYLD